MKKLIIAAFAIATLASPAQSYDKNNLMFGIGVDNLRDSNSDNNNWQAAEGRIEWRGKQFENLWGIKNISPLVGFEADTQGALYGYAGLLYDWNFYDRWHLVPNVAAGVYSHGAGKDLGGWFQFHDTIQLDYSLDVNSRLGVAFTHMSSAGITSPNPGKEDLMLTYSLGL